MANEWEDVVLPSLQFTSNATFSSEPVMVAKAKMARIWKQISSVVWTWRLLFFHCKKSIHVGFFSFHPSTIQQKENKHPSPSWAPMGDTSEFRKPETPLALIAGLNLSLPKLSRWTCGMLTSWKKQTASSSEWVARDNKPVCITEKVCRSWWGQIMQVSYKSHKTDKVKPTGLN